ncbi:DUF4261 domain-containing protein [Butyricimonas virosa]|uniref:DUF4261 domain-containing protein n=1 Tax=Butyricimonas virosa TaxID=544645 RepID=UPI002598DB25|nr:DUF4261 domain-containing protein [Butyricimonas virosa]
MEYPSMEELMMRIRNWAEEENYDAIIEVLPELKTPGQYYEAVLCITYAYLNQGFYQRAEKWLREIENQGKMSGVWNYRLSVALMHQMRLEEALPYAENAVKVEADYPWGWLVYSKLLYGSQRTEEALSAARKGLSLAPGDDEFISLIEDISKGLSFSEVTGVEEDDGNFENGEDKAGTFRGSVLLNSVGFDMNKIMADLHVEWGITPDLNPEDMLDDETKTEESTRVFYYGKTLVAISLIPTRVPGNEAEYFAEANYLWSEAVEKTKTHKAHVLVAVLARDLSPVEAGKLFVKVVATCLKQSNAIGVYVSGTVFQPDFYVKVADRMKNNDHVLPVLNWIYFGIYKDKSGNNAYTYGMKAFGKDEMEILGSKHGLTELQGLMFEIVCYIIGSDVTLHEGETLGVSKEQKLPIIRSKGVSVEGMTLKIEY